MDVSAQAKRENVHFLSLRLWSDPQGIVWYLPIYEGNLLYHSTESNANLFWKLPPTHTQKYSFTNYLDIPQPSQVDTWNQPSYKGGGGSYGLAQLKKFPTPKSMQKHTYFSGGLEARAPDMTKFHQLDALM